MRICTLLLLGLLTAPGASALDGEALYKVYCAQCHGIDGRGKGINAPHMSVAPRDHSNRSEMSGRSDEELFNVVRNGGTSINQSVLMPAWAGVLDDDQIAALVRYMRELCCE